MALQITHFAGFDNCVVFQNGDLQLIVTTEVGPRILFFGFKDQENVLLVKKEHEGLKDGLYHSYGGHRLWVAPEDRRKTYTPDSYPVEVTTRGITTTFLSPKDEFHVQKSFSITVAGNGFQIDHHIQNLGVYNVELAPWAVTVMRPGGRCLVPQHPLTPQGDQTLLPVQPIVLWSYSNMSDTRFAWGENAIQLNSTNNPDPTKFGTFVSQGIAAYSNNGVTFVKRFPAERGQYPDGGCNFESYTRNGMLEVESLGQIEVLRPGETSKTHTELWNLVEGEAPLNDSELREWFNQVV